MASFQFYVINRLDFKFVFYFNPSSLSSPILYSGNFVPCKQFCIITLIYANLNLDLKKEKEKIP